jgi:uncharacterized protein YajQ (UPF0234 family)
MPTFDVVSEVDQQEVRNAVDQASREIANRYDFKDTHSSIDLGDTSIELHTASEDRLRALTQVLEEKLVRRKVSLKALSYGKVEDAAKGTVRQTATLNVGISDVKARDRQVHQGLGLKGVPIRCRASSSRVARRGTISRPRSRLRETDFDILQFTNFRD